MSEKTSYSAFVVKNMATIKHAKITNLDTFSAAILIAYPMFKKPN